MHVEVRCAGAPASFRMTAICCHGLGESLLQMMITSLHLGVLTGGKGVSVHHTYTHENITEPTPSYVVATSDVMTVAQLHLAASA